MKLLLRLSVPLWLVVTQATAQDSTVVVGTAVSALNGMPLPYSTYSVGRGERRFTNADGFFSFRAAPGSTYRIIVRQLGFVPLDTTIRIESRATAPLKFALRGIVYRLAAVRTEARNPCSAEIRGTELSSILEQVSENAEREQLLRQSYPFQYRLERTRRSEWSGGTSRWVRDTATFLSTTVDSYRPGTVVRERATADGVIREMRIPQLSDLADERFLSLHCFSYGGKRRVEGHTVYEIDFEPSREVEFADVRGAVLLDAGTFQIRRADFELTRGDELDPAVAGFRVTTAYRDLAPGLRIFDNVRSVQDFARERPTDVVQKQLEVQRLLDVHFLGATLGAPVLPSTGPLTPLTLPDPVRPQVAGRDSAEAIIRRTTETDLEKVGFYDRMKQFPHATFIGLAELEKRIAADSTNLVPELHWLRIGSAVRGTADMGGGGVVVSTPNCISNVWANGELARVAVLDRGPFPRNAQFSYGRELSPSNLAAIEIYSAGGAFPAKYKPAQLSCGSVLLWTRAIAM